MDLQLKDKLVLITGSTSGIGKAAAKSFLQEGAAVIVNGRKQETVDRTIEELSGYGTVHGAAADLSKTDEAAAFIEKVNEIGDIDILVNNLGFFEVKDFADVTDEEWNQYFEVNVMSAVRTSRHFLPKMLAKNSGRILNIASEAGVKPLPTMIPYSMTKTALISLSRGMAEMTKGTNVTVNSVLPGLLGQRAWHPIWKAPHKQPARIQTHLSKTISRSTSQPHLFSDTRQQKKSLTQSYSSRLTPHPPLTARHSVWKAALSVLCSIKKRIRVSDAFFYTSPANGTG